MLSEKFIAIHDMKGRIIMNSSKNPVIRSFITPGAAARRVFLTAAIISTAAAAALDLFARCPERCAGSVILRVLLCLTAMVCACGFINAVSGFRVWKSVLCSAVFFLMFSALNSFCSIWYSLEFPDDLQSWILGKISSGLALYILPFAAVMLASVLIKKRYSTIEA